MRFVSYLRPLLPSTSDYRPLRRTWRVDLIAGVTVGIIALPLALAFGVSSGAGAEAGLVTAIVAGIVAAVFGGSNIQVSGPTGAMVVVLGPIVASYGVGAVPVVSLMAGVVVLIVGLSKLGRIVSYIPWPVIEGFTLGIAIIIFLQQVPAAVGAKPGPSSNAFIAAIQSFGDVHWPDILWSLGVVAIVAAIMLLAPRIHKQIPGSIIAIILVTVIAAVFSAPLLTIGALPASLPAPGVPNLDPALLQALIGPALTVAALAAIESLLAARVAASISDTGPYDADRELVGQGLASVASGFFGGMPATGAIARTAVNICLVRRANRDGHVMRSFEIPAVGGFMLTEDTEEHRAFFGPEGQCVLYFKTPKEAAEKSHWAIANATERQRMAAAAHAKITRGGHTYTHRLQTMLAAITP